MKIFYSLKRHLLIAIIAFGSVFFNPLTAQLSINCPAVQATTCLYGTELDFDLVEVTTNCSSGYSLEIVDTEYEGGMWGTPCDFADVIFTVRASDACGNSATCQVTYTVIGIKPVFTTASYSGDSCFLPELVKECGDPFVEHEAVIQDWIDAAIAIGGCGEEVHVTTDYDKNHFTLECGNAGYQTVTFTATDACGRTATCHGTIRNIDTKIPYFAHHGINKEVECDSMVNDKFDWWIINHANATAADCCGAISWSTIPEKPEWDSPCDGGGTVEVGFVARDECGLTNTTYRTFTVIDNTPPFFTSELSDKVAQCGVDDYFETPTAEDYCGGVTFTFEDDIKNGACIGVSEITRTWTATDDCGNTATAVQTTMVIDTLAPVFTGLLDKIVFECSDPIVLDDPEVTEECSTATISYTETTTAGSCEDEYRIRRVWVATDDCGNASTAIQEIEVVDTTAPVFTSTFETLTFECGNPIEFPQASSIDNCADDEHISYTETTIPGACEDEYTIIRIWTAADHCGNATTAEQVAHIVDTTAPVFTSSMDMLTFECGTPVVFPEATAMDVCADHVHIQYSDVESEGSCEDERIIERTWTATDHCGNTAIAKQTARVVDTTAPVFSNVPADLVFYCCEEIIFPEPTVADACADHVHVTFEDTYNTDGLPAPNCNNGYGYDVTRTYTATDHCGNVATAATTIWVKPGSPYQITFSNINPYSEIGCNDSYAFTDVMASSDCPKGGVVLTYEDEITESYCGGSTYKRTWTATDECCAEATISQTFVISPDKTAPVFTFVPEDMTLYCGDDLTIPDAIATDDCNGVTVTYTETYNTGGTAPPADCNNGYGYDIFRVWTATDACGNVATANTDVWIKEKVYTLSFDDDPSDKVIACGDAIQFADVSATTTCGGNVTVTYEDVIEHGECNSTMYKRIWTATDECNNVVKTTQILDQVDNEAPEFTNLPVDLALTYEQFLEFQAPKLEAKDCNAFTITDPVLDPNSDCEAFMPTYTWEARDECGNLASHKMRVFISDALPTVDMDYSDLSECEGLGEIKLNLEGGIPPFTIDWELTKGKSQNWKIEHTDEMNATLNVGREVATIQVTITNGVGCTLTKDFFVRCGGAGELYTAQQAAKFSLTPNPASFHVNLEYHVEENVPTTITVYDMFGKAVQTYDFESKAGENIRKVDIRELAPATYVAFVRLGYHTHYVKFIKSDE